MKSNLYIFLIFFLSGCYNTDSMRFSQERLNNIDNIISSEIKENKIPGAVLLVGDHEKIIYQKSFGVKNPLTSEEYKVDDIFRIASMTKAVTSLGIIKLWEREIGRAHV